MKYDIIIAIDPDVEWSGVATLQPDIRDLETTNLSFPLLLDYLQDVRINAKENKKTILVVVEAGHLIKSNWHLTKYDSKQSAASKGSDAGRNNETGRKIVEMCKHYGLKVTEQVPLRKYWKGPNGKISHEELKRFSTLKKKRTNQEERDAALIAWVHANLPIRV